MVSASHSGEVSVDRGGEENFCMHVSWGWVAETELGRDLWREQLIPALGG